MKSTANPLLSDSKNPTADLTTFKSASIFRRKSNTHRRELRDLRRTQTAEQAIDGFEQGLWLYGFTKGQFSIIDVISAVLARTGPAEIVLSTWTAANTDVTTVLNFVESGLVPAARWLVDLTFQRRSPQLAKRIRDVFGADAIRVAKNHAKFALISNADWRVVIQTSMNLNFNPRFENFSVAHDPELFDFHRAIIDEIWTRQPRGLADARPYDIHKFFDADM